MAIWKMDKPQARKIRDCNRGSKAVYWDDWGLPPGGSNLPVSDGAVQDGLSSNRLIWNFGEPVTRFYREQISDSG